ncbi:RDD family protein [Candidatus Poriferisodalis sp.]|uniref:RDD family protein n=1 Tax=Candidatus Poriferisodalis sp. TaxID=3101277 RepID=UPI003B024801
MSEASEPEGDIDRVLRVCLADGTEVVLPTWVRRGLARAIDVVLVAVFLTVVAVVGLAVEFYQHATFLGEADEGNPLRDWTFWLATGYVGTVLYEVLAVAVTGRTFGKLKAGIMVVSTSGGRVSLGRSALRWFVPAAMSLSGVATVLWLLAGSSESLWDWLGGLMGYQVLFGAPVVWLLLYVVALSDRHRRGPHDWAAGTIVVVAAPAARQR